MMAKEHPNKHIREALRYAEQNGWRVVKAGPRAHVWGSMYCPLAARQGCSRNVFSTPTNPENHAKQLRRAVIAVLMPVSAINEVRS